MIDTTTREELLKMAKIQVSVAMSEAAKTKMETELQRELTTLEFENLLISLATTPIIHANFDETNPDFVDDDYKPTHDDLKQELSDLQVT